MEWLEHVTCMEEKWKHTTGFWRENIKEGYIILRCILKEWSGKILTGFVWLKIGTNGRPI
jgi:hypothetical protein